MVVFFLMIVEKKGKKRRHPSHTDASFCVRIKSSIYHLVTNFTLKRWVLPFVRALNPSGASLLMVKV